MTERTSRALPEDEQVFLVDVAFAYIADVDGALIAGPVTSQSTEWRPDPNRTQ